MAFSNCDVVPGARAFLVPLEKVQTWATSELCQSIGQLVPAAHSGSW